MSRSALRHALLALVFALIQLRLIRVLLPGAFVRSAEIAEGVIRGEVAWRIYQSRVLGPYVIQALKQVTGTFVEAYDLFAVVCLFAAGYLVLALTDRLQDRHRPPLAAFVLFQMSFTLMVISNWLYPWDLLAIVVFAVFNFLVLQRARPASFALLYLPAVLNSELAFSIAGWLILDPVAGHVARQRAVAARPRFGWASAWMGLGLLVGGVILVEGLRRLLLVQETLTASTLPRFSIYGSNFHFTLALNWNQILTSFKVTQISGYPMLIPLFLLAVVALAVQLAKTDWTRCAALSVVMMGMVVSFLCFGDIFESRVLMPLIPFAAMHGWQAITRRE